MNNKQRALKAIHEHPGEFTAAELADFLGIKYCHSMKLASLEIEGKAHYREIEVEEGPLNIKMKVPKWFPNSTPTTKVKT